MYQLVLFADFFIKIACPTLTLNPNGSVSAIEGIISPGGKILGKMGHSERIGESIAKNIPGSKDQHIFCAGVRYFE